MTTGKTLPSRSVRRAAGLLHTVALLLLMGALSWGIAYAILGPRITLVMIAVSLVAIVFRVGGGRSVFRAGMGGRRITPNECRPVHRMADRLAEAAGLIRKPELWYIPDARPGAFATGAGRGRAIAVSDGLLRLFEPREIAAVIAHEMAHVAHGDTWIMQAAEAMGNALWWMLRLGLFLLVLALPFFLMTPTGAPWDLLVAIPGYQILMTGLVSAVSRVREFEADRGAAAITGDPEALVSALDRLGRTAPSRWRDRVWPFSLWSSHPSLDDRMARLRRMKTAGTPVFEYEDAPRGDVRPEAEEPRRETRASKEERSAGPGIPDDCPF